MDVEESMTDWTWTVIEKELAVNAGIVGWWLPV